MNTIKKTGVKHKNKGDGLTSGDINSINSATNNCVDALNLMMKAECNLNIETSNPDRKYTQSEAIAAVPLDRRIKGMKLRFFNGDYYEEITFLGDSTDESEWNDIENWGTGGTIIDGGEW